MSTTPAMRARLVAGLRALHPRRFFLDTWREIDARRDTSDRYDFQPLIVFSVGAVCLTLMEYFGGSRALHALLRMAVERGVGWAEWIWYHPDRRLFDYVWWSGWRVLGYLLIPALSVKLMGQRLRDYGLSLQGLRSYVAFYVLAYLVVAGLVVVVSFSPEFSGYYPFYKNAGRSWAEFAAWEFMYAAQFLSLEFFFRGYWLHACEKKLGSYGIFAMVVPYCMIHFGKPWLEALGAVIAGIVLGTLALRTRSIWSGSFIHVAVALSMDVAALLQTQGLPDRLWPY